jgi:hypothetical protein
MMIEKSSYQDILHVVINDILLPVRVCHSGLAVSERIDDRNSS